MNAEKKENKQPNKVFAEVIESKLDSLTAQCWQHKYFPKFGSLVIVKGKNQITIGIVTHIETGSMDPTRYPFIYKKTEEELLAEQPQIFEFIKTIFTVQVVGFYDDEKNKTYCTIPQKPCKIHSFVEKCPTDISTQFFSKSDFLGILFAFANQIPNLDELLLAILNNLNSQKILTKKFLEYFYTNFSLLTGNDYRRLKIFLRRVREIKSF